MTRVYFSSTAASAELAERLVADLRTQHIETEYFSDEAAEGDIHSIAARAAAMQAADVFVCFIADNTLESVWVRHDIALADRLNKPMIPVFHESYTGLAQDKTRTPQIRKLLEHDGVFVYGSHVTQAAITLARMVENTAAWRQPVTGGGIPVLRTQTSQSLDALTGRKLGQYELRDMLGMGGMGAVYRGYQPNLRREVAIKILPPMLAADPDYLERFTREAQTAAALQHAHIVPVYDFGVDAGLTYVVMRLLTGGSLQERINQRLKSGRGLPALAEVMDVLRALGSALDYAHSHGVIHRDIKANNVMFDDQGSPFLVDFGIAKLTYATSALTGTGVAIGTPSYMSPEQWRGESITPATDQYAMGIMTYAMLTGRLPFEAGTPYALMHKHINETAAPPQSVRPDLPETIKPVLDRAMAKDPRDRFPSMRDFANAFAEAIQGQEGQPTGFFVTPLLPKAPPAPPPVLEGATVTPQMPDTPTTPPRGPATTRPASATSAPPPDGTRQSAGLNPLLVGAVAVVVVALGIALFALIAARGDSVSVEAATTATQQALVAAAAETAVSAQIAPAGTDAPTPTPTDTPTDTPTFTPTPTPTDTPTDTPTPTPTDTPTFTPTPTPTNTPTFTPTPTPTNTPTATYTPTPATPLARVLRSVVARIGPGAQYPTSMMLAEDDSFDIVGISADGAWYQVLLPDGALGWIVTSGALVNAAGNLRVVPIAAAPTDTPTFTPTPTDTPTFTPTPTDTPTFTPTPTPTNTPTFTPTPTNTPTFTPTPTNTPTFTPTPTDTPTFTPTPTPTDTPTFTPTPTPTDTPTFTPTPTPTDTPTFTPTPTDTPTPTPTDTPTFTPTPTDTPTSTGTPMPRPTLPPPPAVRPVLSCPGALPSRLNPGMTGIVTTNDPRPVNVRRSASRRAQKIDEIRVGEIFTVIEGPVCSDGLAWFRISFAGVMEGWIAEGDTQYFVAPASGAPVQPPVSSAPVQPPAVLDGRSLGPACPVLIEDEFIGGSFNNWFVGSTNRGVAELADGVYRLSIGSGTSREAPVMWGSLRDFTFSDARIEAVIRASRFTPSASVRTGIWVRFQENAEGYIAFMINSKGQYYVARWKNGFYSDLVRWTTVTAINVGNNVVNTLGISILDNTYSFFINGMRMTTFTDRTWSQGRLAFFGSAASEDTPITFDLDYIRICEN